MTVNEITLSCYSTGVLFDEDFFIMTGDEWESLYQNLSNYAFSMNKYKEGWIVAEILYFLTTVSNPPTGAIPTTSPIMGISITLDDTYFNMLVDFFYNVNGTLGHRITKLFLTDIIVQDYLKSSSTNRNIKDIINNFKAIGTSGETRARLSFTYTQWLEILEIAYSYWILSSGYKVKVEQETLNEYENTKSTIDNINTMVIIILVLIILIVIIMMLYRHRIVPEETT